MTESSALRTFCRRRSARARQAGSAWHSRTLHRPARREAAGAACAAVPSRVPCPESARHGGRRRYGSKRRRSRRRRRRRRAELRRVHDRPARGAADGVRPLRRRATSQTLAKLLWRSSGTDAAELLIIQRGGAGRGVQSLRDRGARALPRPLLARRTHRVGPGGARGGLFAGTAQQRASLRTPVRTLRDLNFGGRVRL